MSLGHRPRGVLVAGERVLLVDRKDRRYLVTLTPGASFQSHAGVLDHDAVIGLEEGVEVHTRRREGTPGSTSVFLVLRPTLADVVVKMPRGAQVIYPKDLGAILLAADVFPGARALEAGVGSGALSLALLRAGCEVTGYELRADFARRARANVAEHLGTAVPYLVEERDVYAGIELTDLDRVMLDLPEPWRVVSSARTALTPGGILCCYVPTINQTAQLREALVRGGFGLAETFEVLRRTWHIEGRSVRPDHRMVAHTGFITTARRLSAEAACRRVPPPTPSAGAFDEPALEEPALEELALDEPDFDEPEFDEPGSAAAGSEAPVLAGEDDPD